MVHNWPTLLPKESNRGWDGFIVYYRSLSHFLNMPISFSQYQGKLTTKVKEGWSAAYIEVGVSELKRVGCMYVM